SPLVTQDGGQTLDTFYLAPVFAGNVLTGSTAADYSGYPGNFFPATDAEVGFVDLSRGNYRLGPASAYKNAATDGKDPGAAIDALEAATAGAVSGQWTRPPGEAPAQAPFAPPLGLSPRAAACTAFSSSASAFSSAAKPTPARSASSSATSWLSTFDEPAAAAAPSVPPPITSSRSGTIGCALWAKWSATRLSAKRRGSP